MKSVGRVAAVVGVALALVAGCTSKSSSVASGGSLVIGAEQEPDCMDWVGSCSGSSWGFWMANITTMPRAFNITRNGDTYSYSPSSLLTGEPTLVSSPTQTITYSINPKAVWNDGTPITSADFKYTWDQIKNGSDIYDQTGYKDIESVDATDPQKAVVTFTEGTQYASWKGLFGGGYGIMPSHILEGQDRAAVMTDGYTFSGGPWVIDSWEKGVSIVLKPNDKYWGTKPKLEQVTFKFVADTTSEFQAFKAGEVSAIYPQPQVDAVEQINAGISGVNKEISANTANVEAMWINNAAAPFDDIAVREAACYAVDRNAVVKALFGGLGVTEAWNSFDPPVLTPYTDTKAFAGCTKDLAKVSSVLTAAGWAKGSDGIWAKDGKKLEFTFRTTAGNARRKLTAETLQTQFADAGMSMSIDTQKAGTLFGELLPSGDFQMALYAQVATTFDPGNCTMFCSENIPSEANDNSGQNWTHTNIPAADPLLAEVDTALDPAARTKANRASMALLAADFTSIPLDPLPNILLWSTKIDGPVSDNALEGPFWNMNEWGLKK